MCGMRFVVVGGACRQGWVVVFVASYFSSTDVSMSFFAAGDYDREMRDAMDPGWTDRPGTAGLRVPGLGARGVCPNPPMAGFRGEAPCASTQKHPTSTNRSTVGNATCKGSVREDLQVRFSREHGGKYSLEHLTRSSVGNTKGAPPPRGRARTEAAPQLAEPRAVRLLRGGAGGGRAGLEVAAAKPEASVTTRMPHSEAQ
jgi:hypothetical protein